MNKVQAEPTTKTTKIESCSCNHDFQDVTYRGKRLHNYGPKSGPAGGAGWTCTVCGNRKEAK